MMSEVDWNKVLWFLFIVSLCTMNSILINMIESKKVFKVVFYVCLAVLCGVSVCWAFFDFWR